MKTYNNLKCNKISGRIQILTFQVHQTSHDKIRSIYNIYIKVNSFLVYNYLGCLLSLKSHNMDNILHVIKFTIKNEQISLSDVICFDVQVNR